VSAVWRIAAAMETTRVMACKWLLLIALVKSASRTRRSNEFQHEFTTARLARRLSRIHSRLGGGRRLTEPFALRRDDYGQLDQHYQMRARRVRPARPSLASYARRLFLSTSPRFISSGIELRKRRADAFFNVLN
jgi:hypothetical protein